MVIGIVAVIITIIFAAVVVVVLVAVQNWQDKTNNCIVEAWASR